MKTSRNRALVIGATGQVGREIMRLSAGRPEVEAIGASRRPDPAGASRSLDLDRPDTIPPALDGIDSIVLITGYTVDMLRQSKAVVDAARRAAVRHVVHLGACGGDDTDVGHYGWHQFVERYIEWSGPGYTHLRPEIFMENLLGYGGTPAVRDGLLVNYVGGARQSWIAAADVAAVAMAVLADPARHAGRTHRLGTEAATFDEIAALMTEELGTPVRYEARSPDASLAEVLSRGGEPAYMGCIRDCFARLGRGEIAGADRVFDPVLAITGERPTSLRQFIRRNAAGLTAPAGRR